MRVIVLWKRQKTVLTLEILAVFELEFDNDWIHTKKRLFITTNQLALIKMFGLKFEFWI